RSLQVKISAIGEQMDLRITFRDLRQPLAEFAIKESHHLAHSLQGKSLASQPADEGDLGKLTHRIQAAVTFAIGSNDTALVPPLQLACSDSRQCDDFPRCEAILHFHPKMFETISVQNVSAILGMASCGSSKEMKGLVTKRVPGERSGTAISGELRSSADKLNNLELIAFLERGIRPSVSGHDVAVEFNSDPVGLHAKRFDESSKRGNGCFERALFPVDLEFHA